MRIAIPISDGRVERVFDCATMLMVVDLRGRDRGEYFEVRISSRTLRNRAREIAAMRVDVLLCNQISHAFESLIQAQGVTVLANHSGSADEVIEAFIDRRRLAGPSDDRPPVLVAIS